MARRWQCFDNSRGERVPIRSHLISGPLPGMGKAAGSSPQIHALGRGAEVPSEWVKHYHGPPESMKLFSEDGESQFCGEINVKTAGFVLVSGDSIIKLF